MDGSKVSSTVGTLACMIWKGTPYYAHIDYNDKRDPADDLTDEDVTAIDEIPVYSINKPKAESLVVLKILDYYYTTHLDSPVFLWHQLLTHISRTF